MARSRKVAFTEDAAARVAKATLAVERGGRDQSAVYFRQPGGDDGEPIKIGKTTSTWNKGTLATITLYNGGTPPAETAEGGTVENCVNKFGTVASGKWVAIAQAANGYWYLIASEC